MIFAQSISGFPIATQTWDCLISGCDSSFIVPNDRSSKEIAEEIGWKRATTLQKTYNNKVEFQFAGYICHLHEVNDD